jgi:hypothetical protein
MPTLSGEEEFISTVFNNFVGNCIVLFDGNKSSSPVGRQT